jgi:DAK2 domain fusion protein YloV
VTTDPSIQRFRRVVEVALRHLEARREEINDLNVFPVADGDTGDNMARTMDAVRQALDRLERDEGETASRQRIVSVVAEAALLGARGNSGVITSQIVRGAAEVLATPTGRLVDPAVIVESLQSAARAARSAVAEPVEGTILTAIDEMARAAEQLADQRPLTQDATDLEQNALLAEMLGVVLGAGEEAVRRTPEQLQVLADAETVDAGAYALVVLVRGMVAGLIGDDSGLPELPHYPAARIDAAGHADSRYDYCLNLIVRRRDKDLAPTAPDAVRELGDSLEVVGDASMLRVHIHTDEKEKVVALFEPLGEVHVDSADYMPDQIAARRARGVSAAASQLSVVAVCDGSGFERLFAGLGVETVAGGPKLNPSTEEILTVVEAAPGAEVVILPNSPNVVLAAEEAAARSAKTVVVAPCHSMQAALEAVSLLDIQGSASDFTEGLEDCIADLRTAAVAEAAREDREGRFAVGDAIGLVGDDVVAWGTPQQALEGAIAAITDGAEVLTVISGATPPLDQAEVEALVPEEVEASLLEGRQQTHWWLLAAQ